MDNAEAKKRPSKTFGKRSVIVEAPPTQRSSSIDSILGDENERLQTQINQIIHDDLVPKKSKLTPRSDFMTELDNLSSDEEFDEFAHGIKKPKHVKSVHELVEAGENSRFFDEIEYLVEGLCAGSEETRTLSLEELTKKVFCTAGFGGRMRAHGKLAMTIDRSFSLVHKSRVRECLALLLINLCHELRKLDAFISTERLVHLSKSLIHDEDGLSGKNLGYLKQTQVFKEMEINNCSAKVLGLWLLAKVCQSTNQASSKDEINSLVELLSNSGLEHSLVELLATSNEELDEFGSIQLRWCLVPLQFAFKQALLENTKSLVKLLNRLDNNGPQNTLLSLDIARVLVCLTGPDDHQAILSKDLELVQMILECTLSNVRECSDETLPGTVCMVSTLVNLVDRSKGLCQRLSSCDSAFDLATQFSSIPTELKIHVGLLLSFIVSASANPQRILAVVSATNLSFHVTYIMEHYRSAKQLTPSLETTFIALLDYLDSVKE